MSLDFLQKCSKMYSMDYDVIYAIRKVTPYGASFKLKNGKRKRYEYLSIALGFTDFNWEEPICFFVKPHLLVMTQSELLMREICKFYQVNSYNLKYLTKEACRRFIFRKEIFEELTGNNGKEKSQLFLAYLKDWDVLIITDKMEDVEKHVKKIKDFLEKEE